MEIGLTSRMQKQCKITKLPESTQENLFYSWDVNIDKYKNRNVIFIANNRLGCIICGMKPSVYKNVTEYHKLVESGYYINGEIVKITGLDTPNKAIEKMSDLLEMRADTLVREYSKKLETLFNTYSLLDN